MDPAYTLFSTGGNKPGIYKLELTESKVKSEQLIPFINGQSVYRIALSPALTKIASVTKLGEISVFENNKGFPVFKNILYFTQQLPRVVSIAFSSEKILLASGIDNQIRIYDLGQPKHEEKIGVIKTPDITYALSAISESLIAGLSSENGTDHLMIWDLRNRERIFKGPAFKMAAFQLNVAIDIDHDNGFLVHGDYSGNLFIYNTNNDFQSKIIKTEHGNFYGVAFNDSYLFTAGDKDNGKITRWSVEPFEKLEIMDAIKLPVSWLSRLDKDHLVAGLEKGQLLIIDLENLMSVRERIQVADIRHLTGLPSHLVISISEEEKIKYLQQHLQKIQTLFETGQKEKAYQAIAELEQNGFKAEALQALAIAEQAQGLLLNELEALLSLLNNQVINESYVPQMNRLAELLEIINEPELAINTLSQIIEINGESELLLNKIEQLSSSCIPYNDCHVLLKGFPNPESIKPEFRKAEILGRAFEEAIVLHEETSKPISRLTLDKLKDAIAQKAGTAFDEPIIATVISKNGSVVSDKIDVIRVKSMDDALNFIEEWVEIKIDLDKMKIVKYRVFYPTSQVKSEKWNIEVMKYFETVMSNKTIESWFFEIEKRISNAYISVANENDADDIYSIK